MRFRHLRGVTSRVACFQQRVCARCRSLLRATAGLLESRASLPRASPCHCLKQSLLLAEWPTLRHTSLYVDERTCSLIRIKVFPDCYACGPEAALLQLAEIALQGFGTSLFDFGQVARRTGAFDRLAFRFTNLFRYLHGSSVASPRRCRYFDVCLSFARSAAAVAPRFSLLH